MPSAQAQALAPAALGTQLARTSPTPLVPTWLAADLVTGAIYDELPLNPAAISAVIGQPMSCSMDLVLGGAPKDWQLETTPGRSLVVCVVDDTPIWAGIVIGRDRGSDPTAALSLVTPEAYLDRRYASNHTWTGVDECSVVGAGLIGDCAVDGIGLLVDAPASGTVTSQVYADSDDKSVLSALTSLMEAGSPEFTIGVSWHDATHGAVDLTAHIARQLGTASASPDNVFEMPGCVTTYKQSESYQAGSGATAVRAYGNGEGATRASSGDVLSALIGGGWPRWDYRWTPNQNTTDPAVLGAAAAQAIMQMAAGTSVWAVTAAAGAAPLPGRDWGLGDDIALLVQPTDVEGTVIAPGHPDGVDQVLRALGWTLDLGAQTLTPVLAGGN